jgi:hypothetical protein
MTRSTRRVDRRWVLPGLLVASTIPHALLVFHGTPLELGRHGAVMSLVLVMSCWWMIALAIDTRLTAEAPSHGSGDELDLADRGSLNRAPEMSTLSATSLDGRIV